MIVPVTSVGDLGLNKDRPPMDIPPGAWTHGANVRFYDGSVNKAEGHSLVLSAPIATYGLFPVNYDDQLFWALTGLAAVHGFQGGSTANITRAAGAYTGTVFDLWNGDVFNKLLFLNNGVDVPQVWNAPGLATPLVDLANWPASTTAKALRAFKQFLVALDVTVGGTRHRRRVHWSHSATSGIPSSWDETNPALDAGVLDLPDGQDGLIWGEVLGDVLVLYTEGQTWYMRLSKGQNIFNFYRPFDASGILAQQCAVAFRKGGGPNMHFVATQDDFIIHDTTRMQSVAETALRKWFLANLDTSAYTIVHTILSRRRNEVWTFFPTSGSGLACTAALVWNYESNTWSLFDEALVPMVFRAARSQYGITYVSEDTWDAGVDEQWDTGADEAWSLGNQEVFSETILMTTPGNLDILQVDGDTFTAKGVDYESYVENDSLTLAGAENGQPVSDASVQKMFNEVWPVIIAPTGTMFEVRHAVREFVGDKDFVPTYTFTDDFEVGVDKFVSPYQTGRYHSLRIGSSDPVHWKLSKYGLDVVPTGIL